MSKKTAMMELIWQLEQLIPEVKNGNVIDKAFWIEKEKQQIEDAFNEGGCSVTSCTIGDPETGEEYYNETYKPD